MRLALSCLVLTAACSPLESSPLESRADEIIGGTPTGSADPEVFALLSGYSPFCSATLIHPRVLITAAHCVANGVGGVTNHPQGYPNQSPWVLSTWAHPNYASSGLADFDVGLVLLDGPITSVAPKPMQRTPLAPFGTGRALGYGQRGVGANPPFGERYTLTLPITEVTSGQVRYGSPGAAICFGDSGGPLFATINGVETLVGVHSYTNDSTCSGGAGARVDTQKDVIDAWFAKEVCPHDGRCDTDCLVTDFDCTCGPDGQCTAACTRPEFDVDCPANCGADGVCAASACPIPDVDCRLTGALCIRADQCQGQRCTNDPQHPDSYCSMACTSLADCAGLDQSECVQGTCRLKQVQILAEGEACTPSDRCVAGTRCHALEPMRSFCAKPCSVQGDCAADLQCRLGLATWRACVPPLPAPPVAVEPPPSVTPPASPRGCSTSGSVLSLGLAALLARKKRAFRTAAGRRGTTVQPG